LSRRDAAVNDAGFSSLIFECAKPSWASNCAGKVITAQTYIRSTLPGQLGSVHNSIRSDSTEWLNGLSNLTSESYHPNRTGHSPGYLPLVRAVVG